MPTYCHIDSTDDIEDDYRKKHFQFFRNFPIFRQLFQFFSIETLFELLRTFKKKNLPNRSSRSQMMRLPTNSISPIIIIVIITNC
jgi:hypothetical protein